MEREKRIGALVVIGILIISFLVSVASAQGTEVGKGWWENLIEKWKTGEGFDVLEAKIFLTIIIAILLLVMFIFIKLNIILSIILSFLFSFLFTAYISPDAIIGIFTTYDIIPMTFGVVLPLLALFLASAVASYRGSRTLITVQLILWAIAFIIYAGELIIELIIRPFFNWGVIPVGKLTPVQKQYWFITIIFGTIVTGLMTFFNGFFMNFAMRRFFGVKDLTAEANIEQMKRGMKAMKEFGKEVEGS